VRSNPTALKALRQRAGHTGRSLAEATEGKVSQQRISDLETAALPVRPPTAKALAEALDCDIADIVTGLEVAAR
jgi:transcriptional regulator with XRE-family HTH domain